MSLIPMTANGLYAHGGRVVAAWQWVTQRGWTGADREDLVQEMLAIGVARDGQRFSYATAYRRALDVCDPRQQWHGVRQRHSQWQADTALTERAYTLDLVSHVYTQEVLAESGPQARWLAGIAYQDWSKTDAARQEGVTEGAITRRLAVVRATLSARGITP